MSAPSNLAELDRFFICQALCVKKCSQVVVPLCHLYEPQDEKTCKDFDFPVVLSGHDHHVVDRWVEGTRLLKPGQDGIKAVILDLSWPNASFSRSPVIEYEIVTCWVETTLLIFGCNPRTWEDDPN